MRKARQRLWERRHLARETNALDCARDFRGQDARAPGKSLAFSNSKNGFQVESFRVAHASRVLRPASRRAPALGLGRDAQASTRDACATRNNVASFVGIEAVLIAS